MRQQLEWNAFEHEHIKKTADWFWAFGIIAITGSVVSIIFSNILFAIVILVGAFVLSMHVIKGPSMIRFRITNRGIIINNTMYPYTSLESFWIEDENTGYDETREYRLPKLLIKSKKLLATHIVIPIKDISPDDVRDYLAEYLEEEEDSEPLAQKIMEFFGF